MSRGAVATVLALVLVGAAGAGMLLWERGRARRDEQDRAPVPERLLVGFAPQNIRRVRFTWKKRTLELVKRHGTWEPTPGTATPGAVRVDVLLAAMATLRARLLPGNRGDSRGLGSPTASVKVWRSRARPLVLKLFERPKALWLTTSDRPGVYLGDTALLTTLARELQAPPLKPLWRISTDKLASVKIEGTPSVSLLRRSGRWYVEDGAALAPADGGAVHRLLGELAAIRITHGLGRGAKAVARYGLQRPLTTVHLDDGTRRTVRLGGSCPRKKGGVVATLGEKPPTVYCVTPPLPKALSGPFVSNRLLGVSPDEIRAINIVRGRRALALVNRPGRGGWKMISPSQRPVDQVAAATFVAKLARLEGRAPGRTTPTPPPGSRRAGSLLVTPLAGGEERVEIFAGPGSKNLWVRRIGGGRWLQIRAEDRSLLAADPVLLRARDICAEPNKRLLFALKTHPGRVTELLTNQRGTWQLVLLAGSLGVNKALTVGARLQDYRPAARRGAAAPCCWLGTQTGPIWMLCCYSSDGSECAHSWPAGLARSTASAALSS